MRIAIPLSRALCAWLAALVCLSAAGLAGAASKNAIGVPGAHVVQIENFSFNPPTLNVPAGTTVTWVNHDDEPHTATSSANPRTFASPPLDTGDTFSFTFSTPGTYPYFCAIHPHMVGTIIVK